MSGELLSLALLGLAVAGMLLVHDWRPTVALLLAAFALTAAFVAQQRFSGALALGPLNLPAALQVITGLAASGMLVLTGLTFTHDYNLEDLDEFGLMELRRAVRRAARLQLPKRWTDYLLPAAALVVVGGATALLPPLYAAPARPIDYAWIMVLLAGLLQILTTQNLLKIGCGLLVIGLGLQLLYIGAVPSLSLLVLALLNLGMLALALIVAYLSGLVYGRVKTLELPELYRLIDG